MKKILFGITGLTLGGAERVLVDIVNKLCNKYEITIFTIYAKGELEKQLDKRVKLKSLYNTSYLGLSAFKRKIIAPMRVLLCKKYIYKKYIKGQYDAEIAFLEGPITRLFSVSNPQTKKIVWIHNDISKVFGKGIKSKLKKLIDKNIYSKYEKLVFVSKDNLNNFEKIYKDENIVKKDKRVIYNYIDAQNVRKKAEIGQTEELKQDKINFVTVARLVQQKAIDRTIKAYSNIVKEYGNISRFYVIGDGPQKSELQKLICEKNVQDSFLLLGKKENPYPYIKKADYFCLLSEFEGYGMVLEEAKILDKNIIITDTAAREAVEGYNKVTILENSENGIYKGIKNILKNKLKDEAGNVENTNYNNEEKIEDIIKLIGE